MLNAVAPLTGAWIEIFTQAEVANTKESLPSRERGLKLEIDGSYGTHSRVAPLTGVWIEIDIAEAYGVNEAVAPLTGAWIEIQE